MFRASSTHLQEDTVVYMQHMVLSLSMRVPGGLSVHNLSENLIVTFRDFANASKTENTHPPNPPTLATHSTRPSPVF